MSLEIILAILMFVMCLISISLSIFYTFRIERAYEMQIKNYKKL